MKRAYDPAVWTGRDDTADGAAALRWHQVVKAPGTVPSRVSLLGFACDAGVLRNQGRPGAAEGPAAIRRALANLAAHGVGPVDDLGDVACEGDALEEAQAEYAALAGSAIRAGSLVIGLGGGHEIAWASYRALRDALEASNDRSPVGIVNFDAHFDLRGDARATSGTPFRQILEDARERGREAGYFVLGISRHANTAALFERARDFGAGWVEDVDLRTEREGLVQAELSEFVERYAHLYLTVCLDALPAAAAPGVSAPAALGVDPALVERLAALVIGSGSVRVADVAELCPRHDIDGRTARLAARYVAGFASGGAAQRAKS